MFSIRPWCAQVTVSPDVNKISVFRRGIWVGLNGSIPLGGQSIPISMAGLRLLWKNPQKKDKKKNTSEVINRIIPHRRPVVTTKVWCPWNVPSRMMFCHH